MSEDRIGSLDYTDIPWVERMKRENKRMRSQIDRHHELLGWDGTNGVNFVDHVRNVLAERDTLRDQLAQATKERDDVRATIAAMTSVVEAAVKVRDLDGVVADLMTNEPALYDAVADMYDAVDAYRAAKAKEPSNG